MELDIKIEDKRYALPLTIEQSDIVVKSLNVYYEKILRKTERLAKKYGDEKGRSIKDSQALARIQECVQFVTLVHNIVTKKMNPDLLASGGLANEEETTNGTGKQEHTGSEGETPVSS